MVETRGKLAILACESGRPFAEKILKNLSSKDKNIKLIESEEIQFANSERKIIIKESIRGSDLYVVQDVENSVTGYSVDENLRALKIAVDAAFRGSANRITAILPAFPYARQDRQSGREGITAAVVAREIEDVNTDHIITLDIHNTAIEGFFRKATFENLRASKNIIKHIRKNKKDFNLKNMVVMAPDAGGVKRAKHYSQQLKADLVLAYKDRKNNVPNVVAEIKLLGDVKGKEVLIPDDMIDTAGTLIKIAKCAKEEGAKKVYAVCSLPLLNGPAINRLRDAYEKGYINKVISTDAVYHGGAKFLKKNPWYEEVSVASYFAKVIKYLNNYKSVSELLR